MSTQQKKFTQIADVIRSCLGITDKIKPNDFVPYITRVYNAGIVAGGEFYNTFWDTYQENGNRYHWNGAFGNKGWTDVTYNPKRPITQIKWANEMFQNALITDTKIPLDFEAASQQTSYPGNVFENCTKLKTIRTLTVYENMTFAKWFDGCSALENILFEGKIGNSINFQSCKLLTDQSINSIIGALKTLSEGEAARTITFFPDITEKLVADGRAAIIEEEKGWTLTK